ncbi:MAG: prepilin-type N-terminal cleavage/methylation domain-containing protein [Candidatus Xenobiia bacterium LiM19]
MNRSISREKTAAGAFTLIEVMVAIGLLAITLLFTITAISSSLKTSAHARQMEAAAEYGRGLIEEVKASPLPRSELPKKDIDQDITIGTKECHVVRSIYHVDRESEYTLQHVVVVINWKGCKNPLVLSQAILTK